jgi:hypothetical protein
LGIGFLWHPTVGTFDTGIDSFIELRNRDTGELLNRILQVQSKATTGKFTAETATGFSVICDETGPHLLAAGHAEVILVVTRPREQRGVLAGREELLPRRSSPSVSL